MSQVVDTKVVEMQFDNSKFEKNIEVSLNSLKFLNKNIEDAGKNRGSLDELAKAGDQVGLSFDNMNMKSKISLNMFDMLAGVGTKAFNRISDAVAGFALNMANSLSGMQAMRDGFAEYELKMGSVQTILAGAKIFDSDGKSIEDEGHRLDIVNKKLEELNTYSDKTIYSFKDMTANIGKFTNAGVNLDDSVQAIQGVANVAAVSGANANEASRAMYNFSQALSSGAVKLIDWKSIENANMATVEFKQQLLDTAVAMGTVVKEGDMYQTTTTNAQGKVSDLFNATTKFNDALGNQWMTTDVLTQTLKNYSTDVNEMTAEEVEAYKAKLKSIGYTDKQVEGIVKLSKKAFAAATEVKTFSQMIDTLKESLGSGWAQSFEIIFGDFKEAKALWTELNNTIDGILSPIGKARNEMLRIWKEDGGREAIIQSFRNLYHAVQNLFAPLKELWKALTPNVSHTGKGLATISKGIEKLTGLVAKGASVIGKALAFVLKPVIFAGNLIGKGILKLIKLISSAFRKIVNFFAPVTKTFNTFKQTISETFGSRITQLVNKFKTTISKIFKSVPILDLTRFKNGIHALGESIKGLFNKVTGSSGVTKFVKYLAKLWDAFKPIVSKVAVNAINRLSTVISKIAEKFRSAINTIGDKILDLVGYLKKIDLTKTKFYKFFADLPNKIRRLTAGKGLTSVFSFAKGDGPKSISSLSDKFAKLKKSIDSIKMPSGLKNLFDNITNFIKKIFGSDSVGDDLSSTLEKTAEATDKVAGEKSGKKLTAFQKFITDVADAFNWLKTAAGKAKDAIEDFIRFVVTNTPKAAKAFYNFVAGDDGILTMTDITDAVYMVSDAFSTLMASWGFSKIGDAAKNMSGAFEDLSNSIITLAKRAGNKMNMSAVRDFAIAVGIVVGAMWVLSKIPADKLKIVSVAIVGIGYALKKFFDSISSGSAKLTDTAGFIPIAILLIAISTSMIAMTASIGLLIGALAIFPKVIKQYNNLGNEFRTGMDRVKEVLGEIFEYLDHTINARYGFKAAAALLALVTSLSMIRKTIVKFASKKMAKSMEDGLARIKEVLELLGGFLSSTFIASFSFINVGVDLDTFGMAAMIFALGSMIEKITPAIERMAKLKPKEYKTAFKVLETIFFEFGAFIGGAGLLAHFSKGGLGEWLGIAATVTLLAGAISSSVESVAILADLAKDQASLNGAMTALCEIFLALGGVLAIIGMVKPKGGLLNIFSLTLAIGALTACVVALYPLAKSHPDALEESVNSLMKLMVALGGALYLAGKAGNQTSMGAIAKLIGLTFSMVVLTTALRRLSKTGGDAESIFAAGTAISMAVLSMAGALRILNGVVINPLVIGGLAALAAAIWGVAFAIKWFKGSVSEAAGASQQVSEEMQKTGEVMGVETEHLAAIAKDAFPNIFEGLGPAIKEALGNFNLGDSIRSMISTVVADAKNWAQDFIDIGTNLIDGLSQAITNPSNVEKVKQCFVELGKALLESFKLFFGIKSPSTVMAEQGGFILDGLVQGLMEFPSKLSGWVSSIGSFILGGIQSLFTGAIEKGRSLVSSIASGIQNGKQFVTQKATEIGTEALEKLNRASEWADKALESATSYANALKSSGSPIKKAAGIMIGGATSAVSKIVGIYKSFGSSAASTFVSQLKSGAGPVKAAAKALVAGAKAAFSNIKQSFTQFGKNAAEGFRNGINNMISKIAEKAKEMVRRAKEAAKKEQNSNSPSKDFMEFGGWAAEGYALGLSSRQSAKLIEANAQKMIGVAKNAMTIDPFNAGSMYIDSNPAVASLAYAMAQISDIADSDIDLSPTIRPVIDLSNVEDGVNGIGSLFNQRFDINASTNSKKAAYAIARTSMYKNDAIIAETINALSAKLDTMSNYVNEHQGERIDPNQIYEAVRQGASHAEIRGITLNGRELKRGLRDMGVVTR